MFRKKKNIAIFIFLLMLVLAAIFVFILLQKDVIVVDPTPEYMIEIRIENRTEQRFENLKIGIVDVNDTVLEDIDFEEDDENVASFWVGYTDTTEFYFKIKTLEGFVETTFDIKEKDQVENPQLFFLLVIENNGQLKIEESPQGGSSIF